MLDVFVRPELQRRHPGWASRFCHAAQPAPAAARHHLPLGTSRASDGGVLNEHPLLCDTRSAASLGRAKVIRLQFGVLGKQLLLANAGRDCA